MSDRLMLRPPSMDNDDLDLTPVVACELHSQVPAVAAGFLSEGVGRRVIYVMTDTGTLEASASSLLPILRRNGLIHAVLTIGHCSGGDRQAINIYAALLTARKSFSGDLIIVGQGPGESNGDGPFAFSGIDQGETANATASLAGRPIICVHPDYHTLTVLDRVARCRCTVPVARDAGDRSTLLRRLHELNLQERHDVLADIRGQPGVQLLEHCGFRADEMAASSVPDRHMLLHASAAGVAAARMIEMRAAGPG